MRQINNRVRPLSFSEAFYADYKISVQLVCEIEGELTPEQLQFALNEVCIRHPFLSCQILREAEQLYFIHKPNLNIPLRVLNGEHTDRDLIITQELNTPLDESTNLIRAVMLCHQKSCCIVLTIHHAIIDGLSSLQLLKNILELCGELIQFGSLKVSAPSDIQPSIEELLMPLVHQEELIAFIERFRHEAQTLDLHAIKPFAEYSPEILAEVKTFQLTFSEEETRQLFLACKTNKISLHSTIAAAHLIEIRSFIDDDDDTELMLRCNTPVDLRQRISPQLNNEHLLSAATGCGTNHWVSSNSSIVALADDINSKIKESINNRDVFKGHLTFMDTLMKYRMPNAVGISSVGLVDIPKTYHGLECKELHVTGVYQLPMFGVTTYTYANKLSFTYLYVEPYYSTSFIEDLARQVKKRLLALIG